MIYCYCEGCKHHDDEDDTCKLNTITVSNRDMTAAGFLPICQEFEEFDPSTGAEAYLNEDAKNVIEAQEMAIKALSKGFDKDINVLGKYERHYDHTDCIWYRDYRSKCPVTCSQYRDGWNDAMNYIFKNGEGYKPYRRG